MLFTQDIFCNCLTGYKTDDLVGNAKVSYSSLIHEDDRQMVWDNVQIALQNKGPFNLTYRITTADQRELWVWEQGQGIFDANNDVIALEGFITDITANKRMEIAIEESEEKFRSLAENQYDVVWTVNENLEIDYISPSSSVRLSF